MRALVAIAATLGALLVAPAAAVAARPAPKQLTFERKPVVSAGRQIGRASSRERA